MRNLKHMVAPLCSLLLAASAIAQDPFGVSAELHTSDSGDTGLKVTFSVPKDHYIYADRLAIHSPSTTLQALRAPEPVTHDEDGMLVKVHEKDVAFEYALEGVKGTDVAVTVKYQGCGHGVCFMPQTKNFRLPLGERAQQRADSAGPPQPGQSPPDSPAIDGFRIARRATGYLSPPKFLSFLKSRSESVATEASPLSRALEARGIWLVVLLILVGGLALNLTPCVLPMIPINIAIIGAGAQGGSRARGLLLGGLYGLGIAIAYGTLGVVVVLTGAKFGALNSSPIFNLAIAALFTVMSLAMFGVIDIDFSRFQAKVGTGKPGGSSPLTAFVLGSVAALLAGACVAPVLISVLILAADMHSDGNPAGLLLPFLLGAGMALPWPFAGAGLSFLPKPGRWMQTVKYGFGVLILLFALWYGKVGFGLLRSGSGSSWDQLRRDLDGARGSGKPVLVDFWATWCKNCVKMEKTTFEDETVRASLKDFVIIKFQAERPQEPDTKEVLDRFGVLGLPTYAILEPAP